MKSVKSVVAVLLIAAGVGVIAYPWAKAWYFNMLQARAMQAWQDMAMSGGIPVNARESDDGDGHGLDEDDIWEEDVSTSFDIEYVAGHMEGILTVSKIGLRTPVLTNATKNNLDIAVCSVKDTGEMGQAGNYVLAGHKSRIYGRHFNRLLEVASGDVVIVENGTDTYKYDVYEVFSVKPHETWVLEPPDDDERKIVTLITCDYRMNPIGRFIVRGELRDEVTMPDGRPTVY